MVVDDPLGGVEGDGEARPRPVQVQVDDVAVGRDVLDLREAEEIASVIVEVLYGVACGVEDDRLAPHVGRLRGAGEEQPPLPRVGAHVQSLAVGRE